MRLEIVVGININILKMKQVLIFAMFISIISLSCSDESIVDENQIQTIYKITHESPVK